MRCGRQARLGHQIVAVIGLAAVAAVICCIVGKRQTSGES